MAATTESSYVLRRVMHTRRPVHFLECSGHQEDGASLLFLPEKLFEEAFLLFRLRILHGTQIDLIINRCG